MQVISIFYLFVGLAAARSHRVPVDVNPNILTTGGLCCGAAGTADTSGTCAKAGLNSFCCIAFRDDFVNPFGGKGGCDAIQDFTTGRLVKQFVPDSGSKCQAGNSGGFIGCA
ncbi:hypothetical protein ACKVWC_007081 [Pyricularia oryzae]